MAIRGKDEETKNGMTIITNMNGEKRANEKLEAKYEPGITSKELNKLPGDTIQEKIEKKFERQRTNGLNDEPDEMMVAKLNRKEKNDLALLKTKEENSDTFGPLSEKEKERLNELLIKEKED